MARVRKVKELGRPRKGVVRNRDEFAKENIVNMKGTSDYGAFVDRVHKETGIPKAELFRRGFKLYCENNGHGTPPPI